MIEFFIALFGSIFYGHKYLSEKSKLNEYENNWLMYRATREAIEARYVANPELRMWAEDFVSSGNHFDEICNWFADDFQYIFGNDWKNKLYIPHYYSQSINPYEAANHGGWVYHLLLAKEGKINWNVPGNGFLVGGISVKDMNIKFTECIERQLINAGVQDIRFALELDDICGTRMRTPDNVCGGHIKIESLCHFPSHRLWDDYIQK